MCTLSFYPKKNGEIIFTFNRDEQPSRSSVEVIYDEKQGILYPKDKLHNGTWLTADAQRKRIVCLLNGAFFKHERQLPYRKSRGLVVLDSLKYDKIDDFFTNYDFTNIEPFTMIVWEQNSLFCFRWDGENKHIEMPETNQMQVWSSCTLYDETVQIIRKKWFTDWQNTYKSIEFSPAALWHFHQIGGAYDLENALKMARVSGVETVSTTQIIISKTKIKFHYYEFKNDANHSRNLNFEPQYSAADLYN